MLTADFIDYVEAVRDARLEEELQALGARVDRASRFASVLLALLVDQIGGGR